MKILPTLGIKDFRNTWFSYRPICALVCVCVCECIDLEFIFFN